MEGCTDELARYSPSLPQGIEQQHNFGENFVDREVEHHDNDARQPIMHVQSATMLSQVGMSTVLTRS